MARRPGTCADCGTERKHLHRHHLTPVSQGGEDGPVILICANCHEDRHGGDFHHNGLSQTPEANAKRADTMRERWQDPKYRRKQERVRKTTWTPERRAAHAEFMRNWFKDNPEKAAVRAARIAASRRGKKRA